MPAGPCTGALRRKLPTGHPSLAGPPGHNSPLSARDTESLPVAPGGLPDFTRLSAQGHLEGTRSLPSVCILAGRLPRPHAGRTTSSDERRECLTDSSARSWSSAASVSRPPGRGPARFQRPIPWRCSSATTPRTCIAPSSRGTTSRKRMNEVRPNRFRARRGRVPRRAIAHQHIPDLVRPDGRPCGAPVPPSELAPFAFGGWAGDRRRRGPSPGQSHREPGSRMADDPGARPLYQRGDFRRGRVRQNVGVYAPVRPPALELARDESRAARGVNGNRKLHTFGN